MRSQNFLKFLIQVTGKETKAFGHLMIMVTQNGLVHEIQGMQ